MRASAIERYIADNPQMIPTIPANNFEVPVKSAKLSNPSGAGEMFYHNDA
jgi:hypothetical protein